MDQRIATMVSPAREITHSQLAQIDALLRRRRAAQSARDNALAAGIDDISVSMSGAGMRRCAFPVHYKEAQATIRNLIVLELSDEIASMDRLLAECGYLDDRAADGAGPQSGTIYERFIAECVVAEPGSMVPASLMRAAFSRWARLNREDAGSSNAFGRAMAAHGISRTKCSIMFYSGVRLRAEAVAA